jgi:DNA-binding CsgD family transcriptional regulator
MTQPMSKTDRANLERLARKNAALAKIMIGERVNVLRSEVEDQLSAEYKFDDDIWADITRKAREEVARADAQVAEHCRRIGVPDNLRPRIQTSWYSRGESMLAERRAELRKLAQARIDAAAASARVAVEKNLLEIETTLIRGGLDTAEAAAFIDAMPTPEQLLPSVDVTDLDPDKPHDGHQLGWQPPQGAAAQLLAATSATDRESKRQAIAAALAANPDGSNREIARLAGVDHKTVGKLRQQGGETPQQDGENPQQGGEIPSADGQLIPGAQP